MRRRSLLKLVCSAVVLCGAGLVVAAGAVGGAAQAVAASDRSSGAPAVVMPAGCASWDGGGVAAMFCDPEQLNGIEPDGRSKARVKLSGPGLRAGSAAGVSQAVGPALQVGQTLTISGATHVSSRSVLFVSGQGEPAGPGLWPTPYLTVGFAAGNLAHGRGAVTFVRSGIGLAASLRDGSGRIIRQGYVESIVAPEGDPQTLLAYFFGQLALQDNPKDHGCTVSIASGKVIVSPASRCQQLRSGLDRFAKLPATIHGSDATITLSGTPRTVEHFRMVAGRWYLVLHN